METWIDTKTNLEWAYDLGLDLGWEASVAECPDGYRIATVKELMPLLDHTKFNPSVIDDCPFGWNNTWASDDYADFKNPLTYWSVNLITGQVQPKDKGHKLDTVYVREV